jgi:hypothetical protein
LTKSLTESASCLTALSAVVPVIYTSREDPEEKLRALKRTMSQQQQDAKGFAAAAAAAAQQGLQEVGPSGSGIGNSEVSLTEQDRKWRLEPAAVTEWEVRHMMA